MNAPTPIQTSLSNLSAWASFDTLLQRLDITTDPNFWDGLVTLILYQDYFLESQYTDLEEGCVPGETIQEGPNKTQTPTPPNQPDPECLCANSPFYAYEIHGIECTEYRLLYWYHPDYLGHNEFITDMSGLPYQYFHYSAFGETLVEDNAHYGQFSSPYRLNAKELDQEPSRASSRTPLKNKTRCKQTGNYYYGARYYNPTWSVWLSVDPLADRYPHVTPYNFVENNPINLIDPTGLGPVDPSGDESFGLKPILGSEGPNQGLEPLPPVDEPSGNAPQGGNTPPEMWEDYGKSFNETFKKDITDFVENNPVGDTEEYNEKLEDFILNYDYNQVKSENGYQPVELAKYRTGVGEDWAPMKSLDPNLLGTYSSYPPGYVDNPGIPNPSAEIFKAFGGGVLQVPNSQGVDILIIVTLRKVPFF